MANQCFENSKELKWAVRQYIHDPTETSLVSQTYGYPMSSWCVDNLTDLDFVFSGHTHDWDFLEDWYSLIDDDVIDVNFSEDLTGWNTSKITSMYATFHSCELCNPKISTWDVSSVTDMSLMFADCSSFNSDLSEWDVSSVMDMSSMFEGAKHFSRDISGWDLSSVKEMDYMFSGASSFISDISGWDVSSVTEMPYMFWDVGSFNCDISGWDVSGVMDMGWMFEAASSFNSDISGWDVFRVTSMYQMFDGASSFNSDISEWDVSSVTGMFAMFEGATSFSQNLCSWGGKLRSMRDKYLYIPEMFHHSGCPVVTDPNLTATPPGPFCYTFADEGSPPNAAAPATEPFSTGTPVSSSPSIAILGLPLLGFISCFFGKILN